MSDDFCIPQELERYRIRVPGRGPGDDQNGTFRIPEMGLRIEISQGKKWQRLVIQRASRSVDHADIDYIRLLLWGPGPHIRQVHTGPMTDGCTVELFRPVGEKNDENQ